MTVTYTHEVADCRGFGNFWRLLFRWRGSVYKLVWVDLIVYNITYFILSAVYRVVLVEEQRRVFEKVSLICNRFSDLIPVSFVIGFYVTIVIKRWWDQYLSLLWPDTLALFVSTCIHGHDRQGRLMRRTIVRYVNLSFILTLTMITPRAKKRFPSLDHIVEAGFMTDNEKKVFSSMVDKTPHSLYYVPLVWAGTLVSRARREGRIRDDFAVKTIIDELNNLRMKINRLISYDWISIPLVYTQVVTLAVYTFFLCTIMGRQFLDPAQNYPKNNIDVYFPFFTMLQFFFYMGWLKVAEALINPFGEDDDDFEVNWLIDRNIQVSYLIVDEMHNEHPDLTQDLYWDEVFPQELPYTVAAEQYKINPPLGSTVNLRVPEAQQEILPTLAEEAEEKIGDAERMDGTAGVRRRSSTRSIDSSHSRNRNSFLSMKHNKIRPGEQDSSIGSQTSLKKSQMTSNLSNNSFTSSAIKRRNTNTLLQEMSQEPIDTELEEGIPIYLRSSSPKAGHYKVPLPPLATITSSSASTSSSPSSPQLEPVSSSSKHIEPVILSVSRLQVDVSGDKDQDKGASIGHLGKDSPRTIKSNSTTSFASLLGSQKGSQTAVEVDGSMMPESEEPNTNKTDEEWSTSALGSVWSVTTHAAKEDDPPAEERPNDENV